MQNNGIIFNPYEMQILHDREFLPAKRAVMDKVTEMWEELAGRLTGVRARLAPWESRFNIRFLDPKVSRGENYRELPYVVLDYLRHFGKDEVFTFRAMMWWGHGYSFTLHLGGRIWQEVKQTITADKLALALPAYIGVGESPWEYHYGEDNYRFLDAQNIEHLLAEVRQKDFLKISRLFPLDMPFEALMEEGVQALADFAGVV